MDRVNGANTVDIGGGRRGFKSQNAAAGIPGTEVTDKILNDVQEEICAVIENSGLVLDPQNQQQFWEALQSIAAPGFANRTAWLPVLSLTTTAPPSGAALGDAYVIPAGATGAWASKQQRLAEWTGSSWRIVTTKDGHGVSLPDGRIFEKVGGVYTEKPALDVQSGKWNYAVAGGTANALTATLAPAPAGLAPGMGICLKCTAANTGAATLNVNGFGAVPIVTGFGKEIGYGDLNDGSFAQLIYTGSAWMLAGITASQVKTNLNTATTLYVRPNGNDSNSGRANTDASAFQTIQGAWNAILQRYNPSGYDVTIQLGTPGTYEGASFEGSTVNLVLRGDPANPSNYVITRQSAKQWHIRSAMYSVVLDGVKISKSVAGIYGTYTIFGGMLELRTVVLEQTGAGAGAGQYHTYTFNGGYLSLTGSITVIGSASAPFLAQNNGIIGAISGASITLQGSPVWSVGFANVQQARAQLGFLTFVGSATGNRYTVSQNGVLDVAGQGANFLPGSAAGNAVTGGLYV